MKTLLFLCDKRMPSVASLFANRWLSERSSSGLVREMSVASSRSQPTRLRNPEFRYIINKSTEYFSLINDRDML